MKKRSLYILLIPCVLALAMIFHKPILCLAIKHQVTKNFPNLGAVSVSYNGAAIKGHGFLLENLQVADREGNPLAEVKTTYVHLGFKDNSYLLKAGYDLTGCTLHLSQNMKKSSETKFQVYQLLKKLSPLKHLRLSEGSCIFHGKENSSFTVAFQYLPGDKMSHLGELQLHLTEENSLSEPEFRLNLFQTQESILAKAALSKMDLKLASQIWENFSNQQGVHKIRKGKLSGVLEFAIGKGDQMSHFKTDLALHQLKVEDEELNNHLALKFFKINAYLPLKIEEPLFFKDLVQIKALKKLSYATDLFGGDLRYTNPISKSLWEISNFEGFSRFNSDLSPVVKYTGQIIKDTQKYPFELNAKGLLESDTSGQLELDLAMGTQEEKTHTNIFLTLSEDTSMHAKAYLSDLQAAQLTLFQDLLLTSYPALKRVEIEKAQVSTDLHMIWKRGRLNSLFFDNLKITEANMTFDEGWQTSFLGLDGKMKLSFPIQSKLKDQLIELHLDTASGTNIRNPEQFFKEVSGSALMHNNQIESCSFLGNLLGIESSIEARGTLGKLSLEVETEFCNDNPFSSWNRQLIEKKRCEFPLKRAKLDVEVHLNEKKLKKGALVFGYGDFEEKVLFDLASSKIPWVDDQLSFDELCQSCRGSFSSRNLSHNSLGMLFDVFKTEWEFQGKVFGQGYLDQEGLHIKASVKDLVTFDSEDVFVTLPKVQNVDVSQFHFNFKKKSWDISIPLSEGCIKDKKFSLPFEKVYGGVSIIGTDLYATIEQASCYGLQCNGAVSVDFHDKTRQKIKLMPKDIDGPGSGLIRFLQHFPDLSKVSLPLQGIVTSSGKNYVEAIYGSDEAPICEYHLGLKEGMLPIMDNSDISELSCQVVYESETETLEIKDLKGKVDFSSNDHGKSYILNCPLLSYAVKDKIWQFDVRCESKTFDVLRFLGELKTEESGYFVELDTSLSHFFHMKFQEFALKIDPEFSLTRFLIKTNLKLEETQKYLSFLQASGVLALNPPISGGLLSADLSGEIDLSIDYSKADQEIHVKAHCPKVSFQSTDFNHFFLSAVFNQNRLIINKFESDKFHLFLLAEKKLSDWVVPVLECDFFEGAARAENGVFSTETEALSFEIKKLKLPVALFKHWQGVGNPLEKFSGDLEFFGKAEISFSEGITKPKLSSHLSSKSEIKLGSETFEFTVDKPFHIQKMPQGPLELSELSSVFASTSSKLATLQVDLENMSMSLGKKLVSGQGLMMNMSPEMLITLAKEKVLTSVPIKNNQFVISGVSLPWDNQIQTTLNFLYQDDQLSFEGVLKDGFYWVYDQSMYLQNFCYACKDKKLTANFGIDYSDFILDVFTRFDFQQSPFGLITIREGHRNETDANQGLDIHCKYSHDDGFSVQSIDGSIYGIDMSFHKNPRSYLPHIMILSGNMKVDTAGLVKAFPKMFYQPFKELGMGSGYEISGDWMISKKDLQNSYFKGYLKGRDFEFLGFQFKTLLSELDLNTRQVSIRNFSLSDQSGLVSLKELKIKKREDDGSWGFSMPELKVQDFRPCFLKKTDQMQESIKPFVIKDLRFFNVEGTLGYKQSFSGQGYLEFINTFKRDYNLLDIPIEIIGRIGFDMGLFVPVKGKVDMVLNDGKIFLRDLKNSYSGGKRSKFYLSSYKDSFIGLDGSIFIDLKMKQYVLLKITQPFTLSIRGRLDKPQYSLR